MTRLNLKNPQAESKEQLATLQSLIEGKIVERTSGLLIFDWISADYDEFTEPIYRLHAEPLPAWQDFIARSIHVAYGSMHPSDVERFREAYQIELTLIDRLFYLAPLLTLRHFGVLIPTGPLSAKEEAAKAEIPVQPGDFTPAYSKYIAPLMPFGITIRLMPNATPVQVKRLRVLPFLCGLLERPVQ